MIIVEGVPITMVSSESKNIFQLSRNNNKRVDFNNTGEPFHINELVSQDDGRTDQDISFEGNLTISAYAVVAYV